jgi:hypothetical protein
METPRGDEDGNEGGGRKWMGKMHDMREGNEEEGRG